MTRFSDRIGETRPPSLARDGMPPELRTALWNHLHRNLFDGHVGKHSERWGAIVREFYDFHHFPISGFRHNWSVERGKLHEWWFDERRKWWELYNTIEQLAPILSAWNPDFRNALNRVFEREGSRFHFIGDDLTEITDENEIAAINEALAAPDKFAGAREQIAAALRFLGQRPEPDYRNSVSESVSAVEGTLKVLTGLDHADLSIALRAFSKAHPIHGALFRGLDSLYGYTSNEHGIRHALLEAEANVGFAEAKFMVVACAAFMNFLIVKGAA